MTKTDFSSEQFITCSVFWHIRQSDSFIDNKDMDHAILGNDILFKDNLIVDRLDYKNIDTKQKMEKIRKHAIEFIDNNI